MELRFPRVSRSSHLPVILPSISVAYFWLVVVWKISLRPHPSIFSFCRSISLPQMMGRRPPTQYNLVAPPFQRLLYRGRHQSVDCYVLPLNGDHLRPRPRLPLFLMGLALAPQTKGNRQRRRLTRRCAPCASL
jgi:hypothetical protein